MICPHGLANRFRCKQCVVAYNRQYYERTREMTLAKQRERYRTDPELRAANRSAQKAWEARNRTRKNELSRKSKRKRRRAAADGEPRAVEIRALSLQRRNESASRRRIAAIERLGGRCEQCGIQDEEVLQCDHKTPVLRNRSDRERGFASSSTSYREILRLETPHAVFSLLCANCHIKKTRSNGEYRGRR